MRNQPCLLPQHLVIQIMKDFPDVNAISGVRWIKNSDIRKKVNFLDEKNKPRDVVYEYINGTWVQPLEGAGA